VNDVFDLFGVPDEPAVDPALLEAVERLRDAVVDMGVRTTDFEREPDLTAVSDAVRGILEVGGHGVAEGVADSWHRYEASFREASHRRAAWILADHLFRKAVTQAQLGYPDVEVAGGDETLPLEFPEYGEED
jgi:hypothetical protein